MKNATVGSHFHIWGVSNIPDTKNATLWSCSSYLGSRRCRDTPVTKNMATGSHSLCQSGRK